MKKVILFLFVSVLLTSVIKSQNKVYVAEIEGMIDLGLAPYVKRVVEEAQQNSASAIVFKINTFGGRVDAATQIKDAIINSPVKTIAFIDKRAISAGALISLSCDKVIMVPGASIGATTVVDQAMNKQSEKAQSYMRAEMRATAERTGRRTDIAEGMVDETVVVEGLVDSTKLITLTSEEAVKYGMADSILADFSKLLEAYGLQNDQVVDLKSNWAEDFIRFLNNPVITSILMMIALVGLFTEIKTPGWGLPGTAAVISLALFFGAGYILELASIIEIVIFIIGVILLLIEIFVIPGFGIFGAVGIVLMVGSLFLGLISDFPLVDWDMIQMATIQLAAALVFSILFVFILIKFLPKSQLFNKLVLQRNIEGGSGYTSDVKVKEMLGKQGKALTDLRPSGTALIEDKRVDVVTHGEYINKGTKVIVIQEEGSKVVVEKVK
ncbi:MAG: nodulation protein NfeD [Ignavibacteriae bacterium]|nr:nodulation protein NfeD [Ignavibacteriota bacterium]MCB9206704.1 nodulation protein NfeD [Ignavibacteriales bacterium]MCB9210581.1 nodulation protein NfeD [Ignavibacteriales bacterium]MCB9219956.1 nodulation protein NfeD [Ignavibacteriales bacterium]MCB9259179.1 nodulation protein NfeD [Ignavibacteriales bacterium]